MGAGRYFILIVCFAVTMVLSQSAAADVIIDNSTAGTSSTGTWQVSGATGFYGTDSLWSRDGATYTWQMSGQPSGSYEVLMFWSPWPSRTTSAAVDIVTSSGSQRVYVNQQNGGSQWNSLGTFDFSGSGSVTITASNGSTVSTCADAVWFRFVDTSEIIIDNGDSGTSSTGIWQVSGALNPYGTDSLWSYNGATYTWSFTPVKSGTYDVSMWWTPLASRNASVPVAVAYSGGTANLTVDQRVNGGKWNSLGEYAFDAGKTYSVTLTATPTSSPPSTCADAVRFKLISSTNAVPTAVIDSINPSTASAGQAITFSGHGVDTDGTIAAQQWESNIDGVLSTQSTFTAVLSEGSHTISFRVQDNMGAWSTAATQTLTVTSAVSEVIVDNGASGTSSTGTWEVSGGTNPYGSNSLWSRDGDTYTWRMSGQPAGTYEVAMWWSGWSSRTNNAAVDIITSSGTQRVYVNQQAGAGQWNILGTYDFDGTGSVTIISSNGSTVSTCADAVRFKLISSGNAVPTAIIDSIVPNVANIGQTITFTGHGVDTDGTITAQQWESNIDGVLSTKSTFTDVLSQGSHIISFKVQDNKGAWSTAASQTVLVTAASSQVIIDNGSSGTSSTGSWQASGAPNPYGTNSLWSRDGDTYTWQMTNQPSGTYEVLMWWTQLSTRARNSLVQITDSTGVNEVSVDQRSNGGRWNSLGFFKFGSTARVTITAADGDTSSTCADAVMFRLISANALPTAVIDTISPDTAALGKTVQFSGHGTDGDGFIAAQRWESNIDGALSTQSSFTKSSLSQGTHIITFKVMDDQGFWSTGQTKTLSVIDSANEFIIDNSSTASTARTGTWTVADTAIPYGADSLWSRNATTFSWYFTPPRSGYYNLAMWWTQLSSRSTAAAVDVYDADGTHRITVDQSTNGSRWNTLGVYRLNGGTRYEVRITSASGSTVTTCADAVRFTWFSQNGEQTENIYVCAIYSWNDLMIPETEEMLQSLGANQQSSSLWTYRNAAKMTTYYIRTVTTKAAMEAALKEEGSHVIVAGHSNYGMGPVFAAPAEFSAQEITNLYYVNDDHFLNISSPMVSLKPDGMRYGQAYPNWQLINQDGSSAAMPYSFDEGLPPYNYYITYKLPGDPTAYKVELSDGSNLQRFPDSGVPAWYSPTGAPPSPTANPEYFIVNPDPDYCRCSFTGSWPFTKIGSGYMGEEGYFGYNYQTHSAGTGANTATFHMYVPAAGSYRVSASWPPISTNASNAKYTIRHADGTSTVTVNQQVAAGDWNVLGTYNFNRGSYDITLSDNANGRVAADAMILEPTDNINNVLQAEFTASVLSGLTPLAVQFRDRSLAMKGTAARLWNFGDGTTSVEQNPIHLYISPGVYSVSLRVTDAGGASNTETKSNLIIAGSATAPLTANFTAATRDGAGRSALQFTDYSQATITSWLWNFGDGKTSTQANPLHTYTDIGTYTVSLTVAGPGGSKTEAETNYVYIVKRPVYVDNSFRDRPHYITAGSRPFGKVIIDTRVDKIRTQDLKYKRLLYNSCNSASYFLDVLQHGLVFCTSGDTYHYESVTYLQDYLRGYSDADILEDLNKIDPVFEIIDFTRKPPSQR
jgi:PKD repeat protein